MKTLFDRLLAAWHDRALVLKAVSFAAVGVVNSVIDFSVFWTAVQVFAAPLVLANVVAWMIAVTNSYVMNSFVTFARESGRQLRWRAYATFVGANVVGLIANTTTLLIAVRMLPQLIADPNYQLAAAKLCAIMASFLVDFSLSHFIVFRRPSGGG